MLQTTSKTTKIIRNNNQQGKTKKKKTSKRNTESKEISAPLSRARTMQTKQAHTFTTPMREEYVATIPGSVAFNIFKSLVLNPGNPEFSKWGANIAACFESYRYDHLEILWIPRCSANTSGFSAISPDCNPHDPVPSTEQELYANEKAKSDSPWKSYKIVFNKEMLNKRKTYYCRKLGIIPDGADKDLYDVGNLHLASGGQADTISIGQVWIKWKATFYTPESPQPTQQPTVMGVQTTNLGSTQPLGNMNANNLQEAISNPIGSIQNDGVGAVIQFAKDFHGILDMQNTGTGLSGTPSITSLAGAIVNQLESGVNLNSAMINGAGTGSVLNSLITAKKDDIIRLTGPLGSLTSGRLGLFSCGL